MPVYPALPKPLTVLLVLCALPSAALAHPVRSRSRQIHPGSTPRPRRPQPARPAPPREPEKAALEIPDLKTQDEAAGVTEALQRLKGVQSAVVDLKIRLAVVDYDPALTRLSCFLIACREAGFEASEYRVEDRFPKPIKLKGG